MNERTIVIFLGLLLSTLSLHGKDCCCQQDKDLTPFFGGIDYDCMGEADFEKSSLKHQHLNFHVGRARLGSILWYNSSCEEGVAMSLAYMKTHLEWKENPYFDQENYETVSLSLSGFSDRLPDWLWKADLTASLDTDPGDLEKYLCWDLLLWGRYDYCEDFGLHMGFYAITGMKIDRVYPILGIDWHCWRKLSLNLVFPLDISAMWEFNDNWVAGAALRFFESRHRVGNNENLTRALWDYRTTGAEFTVDYNCTDYIHANFHIGYTLGGKLKIADRDNDDPHHFKFKSSPYIGGELRLGY
ncbi:MAG: hypothetical protein ACE5GN_01030 [Waddliaceae bacterium]